LHHLHKTKAALLKIPKMEKKCESPETKQKMKQRGSCIKKRRLFLFFFPLTFFGSALAN